MGPHNINALNFPKMDNFNRKFCTFEKSFPTKNVQPGKISYYGTCFLYCAPQLPSAVHIDNFTIDDIAVRVTMADYQCQNSCQWFLTSTLSNKMSGRPLTLQCFV